MSAQAKELVTLENETVQLELRPNGSVASMKQRHGTDWKRIQFREKGPHEGIRWYGEWEGVKHAIDLSLTSQDKESIEFEHEDECFKYALNYSMAQDCLVVRATLQNIGRVPIQPQCCGLKIGLDTYMESYPSWNNKLFPTLLRSETTHFWGYAMSPNGMILGIASPDPIASWSLDYNVGYMEGEVEWYGHRVETWNLDLLHALPLPARHPQHLYQLLPGENKQWTIYFTVIDKLDEVQGKLAPLCKAPMIELERTTLALYEETVVKVDGDKPVRAEWLAPDGTRHEWNFVECQGAYKGLFIAGDQPGAYVLQVEGADGKVAEAVVSVRQPWPWYMENARASALAIPPRATSHCESWYGLFTLYLAEKHLPNADMLQESDRILERILPLMFDTNTYEPLLVKHRIQNVSTMVSVLVDRYEATGDLAALEHAAGFADWLVGHAQAEDGSYRAGKTHYTSVIYPAKSMLELVQAEQPLAVQSEEWRERAERHLHSAKRAMDELVRADGNIDTEGELTFEDGMISCSALQLGLFAWMQENEEEGKPYKDMALKMLDGHNSLTNLIIPDGRQRGATRRFWESQYDIALQPNMLNSPHGWTSWRTYATWYAYLLTGEEHYLTETMNALGSCVQMIEPLNGKLRWAFVPDPYIQASQIIRPLKAENPSMAQEGHHHTSRYPSRHFVLGEQYLDMISDWHEVNLQDNDVHEHFKCLEEVALSKAYVIEREGGELIAWNCTVKKRENGITIEPYESIVSSVHVNLQVATTVEVSFADKRVEDVCKMGWIAR